MSVVRIHLAAGFLATLAVALFFFSTLFVEAFGSHEAIARAKDPIQRGDDHANFH